MSTAAKSTRLRGHLVVGRRRRADRRRAVRSPTRGRRRRPRCGCRDGLRHLRRTHSTSPRSCCARKASPTSATCRRRRASARADGRTRRAGFRRRPSRRRVAFRLDAGVPITVLAACIPAASSCSRTSRSAPSRDLKGKRVGVRPLSSVRHISTDHHGGPCRARSRHATSNGSRARAATPWSCSSKARSTHSSAFPPEPQELRAREDRPRDPQTRHRPAMVAVFLLHAVRQPRTMCANYPVATKRVLRAILKAADFCAAEPECGRAAAGRWRFRQALRLRAPDAERGPVRPMARVRPGGHAALLRAAAARGRA